MMLRRERERGSRRATIESVASKMGCSAEALRKRVCQAEVIRRRGPWRGRDDVVFATLEWVDRFNNRRLLEPIGNVPPLELEQAC
jgi:transposase InsO family protein